VSNPFWLNGAAADAGAVTWGPGSTRVVTVTNSLIGATNGDQIGSGFTKLANENYVLRSPYWDNGSAVNAGAVTWFDPAVAITGVVTITNIPFVLRPAAGSGEPQPGEISTHIYLPLMAK
jgi:hypothetical protein